jgi:hypothetical protein
MRLSPLYNVEKAKEIMTRIITENPPYNAKVEILGSNGGNGWCMNELEPWFMDAIKKAGSDFFEGRETGSYG